MWLEEEYELDDFLLNGERLMCDFSLFGERKDISNQNQ